MGLLRYTDAESGVVQYIFEDELETAAETMNNQPETAAKPQSKDKKKRRLVRSTTKKQDQDNGETMAGKTQEKSKPKIRDHKKVLVAGLILCLFSIGVGFSYLYSRVDVAGYRIGELKGQITTLEEEQENLQRQVSDLTSLERVEKVAVDKLGMVAPATTDVLLVNGMDGSQNGNDSTQQDSDGQTTGDKQGTAAVAENETVSGSERSSIIQILAGLID